MPCRRRSYCVQQQPQRHLVHVAGLERRAAVAIEARFGVVPAQDWHVGRGHAEQAAVFNSFNPRIEEG